MVDDIPRWRADGHTHRSQPSEQLRQLWSNVVDDEKPWQHAQPVTVVLLWQRERLHCFFAWPACCSLFFHSSYKPFRYKLFLFQKKKKTLKTPYPFEVCSCALDFMVIGHYTNNIHENFQVFTIFSVWQQNYWKLALWGTDDGIYLGDDNWNP